VSLKEAPFLLTSNESREVIKDMTKIGETVRTGQLAPVTGGYECLTHRKEGGMNRIANTKGDPMPPCTKHGSVSWILVHLD